jgi:hypothetical protein
MFLGFVILFLLYAALPEIPDVSRQKELLLRKRQNIDIF